ncbi:hypothetical protein SynA1544_02701 [Synechococcus sp. A15-44]|nr:hypothetical protein SynA1544_02701 [Synechococcus sp. A15-44]
MRFITEPIGNQPCIELWGSERSLIDRQANACTICCSALSSCCAQPPAASELAQCVLIGRALHRSPWGAGWDQRCSSR